MINLDVEKCSVTNVCQVLECKKVEHCMCEMGIDTMGPFSKLVVQAQEGEFWHTTKAV